MQRWRKEPLDLAGNHTIPERAVSNPASSGPATPFRRRYLRKGIARKIINKSLRPFDIKMRTVRLYPVFLQAGLKGISKYLSCRRLIWGFFRHKIHHIQTLIVILPL